VPPLSPPLGGDPEVVSHLARAGAEAGEEGNDEIY
jgi:hypothetical protein